MSHEFSHSSNFSIKRYEQSHTMYISNTNTRNWYFTCQLKFNITFNKLTFSITVNEELILFSLLITLSIILRALLEPQSTFMPNEKTVRGHSCNVSINQIFGHISSIEGRNILYRTSQTKMCFPHPITTILGQQNLQIRRG